ncbi:hypothetical protein ACQZV8_09075 [Magnetococcales bacterium HHB-1]
MGHISRAKVLRLRKVASYRFLAMLSYMGILCMVPLFLNEEDEYINFHARQGLVLWIWSVISMFALHIPGIGPFFFSFSAAVIALLSVIGMISVLFARAWRLPFIGTLAGML